MTQPDPISVVYEGPSRLAANQLFTAKLTMRLGTAVRVNGFIVVAARHFCDMGDPQTEQPADENFVTVECSNPAAILALQNTHGWTRHPWNTGVLLRLEQGTLQIGDTVTVVLGDIRHGSPGYRAQTFAETNFQLRIGVDPAGDDTWFVVPEEATPTVEIVGGQPSRLVVRVPAPAASQGLRPAYDVCVKSEDIYGNPSSGTTGSAALLLNDKAPLGRTGALFGINDPQRAAIPRRGDLRRAYHWITAASDDGSLHGRSNPIGPSPHPGFNLYWGEIHGQSGLCDGTNSPSTIYDYARRAAGLDFAAVTSHDFELTPDEWSEVSDAARSAHEPGRFVTFLGYEWSGATDRGGDNNIYFLDDDAPLIYNGPSLGVPPWDMAADYTGEPQTLTDLIAQLAGYEFMVVPHCGGRACNFDFYDPQVMPLLEIHSCHRSYEYAAHEALRRQLQFGFIGGSDDHRGALGDSHATPRDRYFSSHSGLVAVYAEELTRESLWEAFFAKRVYATNGARMIVGFSINGTMMGGEVQASVGGTLDVRVFSCLDGLLDRVELVRGTNTIHRFYGAENQVFVFEDTYEEDVQRGLTPYYIRVSQTDGGTAWSSPVWVYGT